MHLHGLHLGGKTSRGEADDHGGLEGTDLVHVLKENTKALVGRET